MYWSRTGNELDILLWLLLCALWGLGGWLLVTHAFRLRPVERLLTGLSVGLLLFIVAANLLAQLLPLPLAFWGAGLLVLAGGLGAAAYANRREGRPGFRRRLLDPADLRAWPQLVILAGLTYVFANIGRGLAVFDDYLHLPLVSRMATGDIPPHFYLDPNVRLAYHYGLQVLAASMVRIGGFFPWSAWDFSKALAIALTLVLSWNLFYRLTRSRIGATLGTILLNFAGGARWLLLLLPSSVLMWVSSGVQVINTGLDAGPDLFTALSQAWPVEGAGPFPFPFSFHSGIFIPVIFTLGASGALPYLTTVLLLILTARRRFSPPAVFVLTLVFASLALTAEHLFVFLWGGIALAGLIYLLQRRRERRPPERSALLAWAIVLLLSGVLSVTQGGFLTEALRTILLRLQGIDATQGAYNYFAFSPRWPLALDSAHFAELSLFDPRQLLVLLAELGPALLLAPLAARFAFRRLPRQDLLAAGLGLAALLSFLVPLLFRYGVERSSTRLPATALWIWVLLGFPALWRLFRRARPWPQAGLSLGTAAAVFGGFVLFAVQWIAMPYAQLSSAIDLTDAWMGRQFWDRLPKEAWVLDSSPDRSVVLFGRPAQAYQDFYHPWPGWSELITEADPAAIARAGYAYVYMDRDWWQELRAEQKQRYDEACVKRLAERIPEDGNFRWLLDVQACR